MLQLIREHAQGFIAWIIFGLLILAFALWGIQSYFSADPEIAVAKVNGEEVTSNELQRAIQLYRQRLRSALGERFDPSVFTEERVKDTVMQSLINESILTQVALDAGYRISDARLSAEIRSFEEFRNEGRFDQAIYESLLRNQGMSPAEFEHRMRRDLLVSQMRNGITSTALVTQHELKNLVRLQRQRRDFGYMTVPVKRFMDQVEVDDEAIKARYEENKERFSVPEQVSVRYIELSVDALAREVKPSEEELRAYYEQRKTELGTEEIRHASHILIEVAKDAGDEAVKQARSEVREVMQKLREGASFAELAEQYSDDPGSASQGGDLGFFGRDVMDEAFEEAVFSLSPGEVSDIVRTPFGFHIIKLHEVKQGDTKSFAELRDQLLEEFKRRRAEDRFFDRAEVLETLTYENPDTLQSAADALGLEVKTTGFFTRNNNQGVAIASHPEVREAAFSDDVLASNYNSLPIEISPTRLVVLRKDENKPATIQPLSAVEPLLRRELQRDKASVKARELGEELVGRLKEGGAPESLAEEYDLEWQRTGFTHSKDRSVTPTVLRTVFKQQSPGDEPLIDGVALPQGGYAVYALYDVEYGNMAGMNDAEVASLERERINNAGQKEFQLLLHSLKDKAKVKIVKDNP